MNENSPPEERLALLSVSDKTGLVDLAKALVETFDFEIVSSGGTAKAIAAAELPVTKVADYTGSPEILRTAPKRGGQT